MRVEDVMPGLMIKNEEYWIYYVLRDLLTVFGRAIVVDTGSTDTTLDIIKTMPNSHLVTLHELNLQSSFEIGNVRNFLRQEIKSEWFFLVDGDEIWREDQLCELLSLDVPDEKLVVMCLGKNLTEDHGKLMQRDLWHADRLFRPGVVWDFTDYPYESHGLYAKADAGQLIYAPGFFWHTRHLRRSTKDGDAYLRKEKQGIYPWDGELEEVPSDWIGDLAMYHNPHVGVSEIGRYRRLF